MNYEHLPKTSRLDSAIKALTSAIRQPTEKVRLVPEGKTFNIELFGELVALISLGIGPNNKHPLGNAEGRQMTLVAGARNRRYLHLDFACV